MIVNLTCNFNETQNSIPISKLDTCILNGRVPQQQLRLHNLNAIKLTINRIWINFDHSIGKSEKLYVRCVPFWPHCICFLPSFFHCCLFDYLQTCPPIDTGYVKVTNSIPIKSFEHLVYTLLISNADEKRKQQQRQQWHIEQFNLLLDLHQNRNAELTATS